MLGRAQHAWNGPLRWLPNWVPLIWVQELKSLSVVGSSIARRAGGQRGCGDQEAESDEVAPHWAPWGWVGGIAVSFAAPLIPHGPTCMGIRPCVLTFGLCGHSVTVLGNEKKKSKYVRTYVRTYVSK